MRTLLLLCFVLGICHVQSALIPSSLKLLPKSRLLNEENMSITAAVMPGDPLISGLYIINSYLN